MLTIKKKHTSNAKIAIVKFVNTRYDDNKLGPVALFNDAKLAPGSNKHPVEAKVENIHTISIIQKLSSSSAGTTDLLQSFDGETNRKGRELKKNKEENREEFLSNRIRSIEIFGFVDQDKITIALGYNLTL